jgi:hypothetical protein
MRGSLAEVARYTGVGSSAHCMDTSCESAATFAAWQQSTSPTLNWLPPRLPAGLWRIRKVSGRKARGSDYESNAKRYAALAEKLEAARKRLR